MPFLLIGFLLSKIAELKKGKIYYGAYLAGIMVVGLLALSLTYNPFRNEPNKQKDQVRGIAEFVIAKLDNKPFNFALITPGNSDHGYRYYLELYGRKPVTIETPVVDPSRSTVTDQLMVVCEDPDCKPLGDPLYEIAGFGPAKNSGYWDLKNVKVYKLTHE